MAGQEIPTSIKTNLRNSNHAKGSRISRTIFSIMLFFILFLISFFFAYYTTVTKEPIPTNYLECTQSKGSIIQESYPAVCVTPDGRGFIQEIEVAEEIMEENRFCGGIANVSCPEGYTCRLDGDYPDAEGICVKN